MNQASVSASVLGGLVKAGPSASQPALPSASPSASQPALPSASPRASQPALPNALVAKVSAKRSVSPLTLSIYLGILFFVVASPLLFKLVNKLTSSLGLNIVEQSGAPNVAGLLLHTVVFILLCLLSLKLAHKVI